MTSQSNIRFKAVPPQNVITPPAGYFAEFIGDGTGGSVLGVKYYKKSDGSFTPVALYSMDELEASVINRLDGVEALPGLMVGNVASPIPRNPFVTNMQLDSSLPGNDRDFSGHVMITTVTGDYSSIVSASGKWVWGQSIYSITGPNSGDGNGLDFFTGSIIEAAVFSDATIANVIGLETGVSFSGNNSDDAFVASMRSLNVTAPKRKDGATGGTVTEVYGVKIEQVLPGHMGASVAHPLFVGFGESYFEGSIFAGSGVAIPAASKLFLGQSAQMSGDDPGNVIFNHGVFADSGQLRGFNLVISGTGGGGLIEMEEQSPTVDAPAPGKLRLYCVTTGGKTKLMARFNTGAAIQVASEP